MKWKKFVQEEEKKDDKRTGKPEILKENGQLHGHFYFVTLTVNILTICYIYENFSLVQYTTYTLISKKKKFEILSF